MASYKRKRDGVEAPETVTTCLPSTSSYINEQGKRVRRDAVNGASGMDSACITAKVCGLDSSKACAPVAVSHLVSSL